MGVRWTTPRLVSSAPRRFSFLRNVRPLGRPLILPDAARRGRAPRPCISRREARSFGAHFAKMRSMSFWAPAAARSGEISSRATRANIVGITNVLKTSSVPAVANPG